MGLRVAYISDQKFYRNERGWYTTGSFDIDYLMKELHIEEWDFWGRLYETDNASGLFQIVNDSDKKSAIRFSGLWNLPYGPFGYARGLLEAIKRIKILVESSDVVWLKLPFFYSILAARYCSRRQVVIAHQVGDGEITLSKIFPKANFLGKVIAYYCRKIAREADIPVYVSRALASKYAAKIRPVMICNESRITEQMILDRPPAECGAWKAIFVGRLSPEKSVDDLIRALAYTQDINLVIVGDGPERKKLEELAERLGVSSRITWTGSIRWGERLFGIIRECQAFVLASSSEGFPLVLVEAMSQGLPVVATNVGGIPELVSHEQNGILVPVHRPDEIAKSLLKLKENPEWRRTLAFSALKKSKEHTIQKQMTPLIMKILETLQVKKRDLS